MLKDELLLKQMRQARILEVRRQENAISEHGSEAWVKKKQEMETLRKEEEAVRVMQRRVYQEKLVQKEMLLRQRQQVQESMGKAQQDAEESKRRLEQAERDKASWLQSAQERAAHRGYQALLAEQEELRAKQQRDNYTKECRAAVIVSEAQRAHDRAQRFREEQLILARKRDEEEAQRYIPPGGIVVTGQIDYSKTQFHNPVIVRHEPEGQSAADLADAEIQRRLEEVDALAAKRQSQQQAAAERGTRALTSELLKKEQEALLKELKSMRSADADLKIKAGQKDPVLYSRCSALAEQQDAQKRKDLETEYELIMLQEQKPKAPPRAWQTSQMMASKPEVEEEERDVVELPLVKPDKDQDLPGREQPEQQPEKKVIIINEGTRDDPFHSTRKPQTTDSRKAPVKASLKIPKKAWEEPEAASDSSFSYTEGSQDGESEEEETPVQSIYSKATEKEANKRLYEFEGRRIPEVRKPSPPKDRSQPDSDAEDPVPNVKYDRYQPHHSESEEENYQEEAESDHSHKSNSPREDSDHVEEEDIMQKYLKRKDQEEEKTDDLRYSVERTESQHIDPKPKIAKSEKEETKPVQGMSSHKRESPLRVTELTAGQMQQPPPQTYPMPYMYPMPMYQPVPVFPTYYPPAMQAYPPPYMSASSAYGQSLQFSQSSASSVSVHQSSGKKSKAVKGESRSPMKTDLKSNETPESSLESPLASKYTDTLDVKPHKRTDGLGLYSAFKSDLGKKRPEPSDPKSTVVRTQAPDEPSVRRQGSITDQLKMSKIYEEDKLSETDFIESQRSVSKRSGGESGAKRGGELVPIGDESASLSEAFKTKKREVFEKLHARPDVHKSDTSSKTKEELLEIRRQMLKPQHHTDPHVSKSGVIELKEEAKLALKPDVMERLASGSKSKVSKKDMLQLTSKNYQQLPEVRKKREEEEKKEALKKRLATAKAYEQKRKETKRNP